MGLLFLVFPDPAHAWTPGTHIYLGESVLANLALLPTAVADLLRAYPFDFLYGNIAADSSIAKQLRAAGPALSLLARGPGDPRSGGSRTRCAPSGWAISRHLAADTIAHNYFVPRQLMLTSSTAAVGHSYWETRVEAHLGDAYARAAKDVILLDHSEADAHLDRLIAPTIFSVRTNRRLFRGMVRLTETTSWQRASQVAREYSRWSLADQDVERHLGLSYDFMIELLGGSDVSAHQLDPSGERPLKTAKEMRRRVLRTAGRRNPARLREEAADEHFGLPERPLEHWASIPQKLPWRAPEGAAPSPKALVNGRR